METKNLTRVNGVATGLHIGVSTVWMYVKQGKIKPIKISPRVTLFDLDQIYKDFGIVGGA